MRHNNATFATNVSSSRKRVIQQFGHRKLRIINYLQSRYHKKGVRIYKPKAYRKKKTGAYSRKSRVPKKKSENLTEIEGIASEIAK